MASLSQHLNKQTGNRKELIKSRHSSDKVQSQQAQSAEVF
ncbi:hypothetical protein yrohd0001_6190 [Yersinia rohdei ATCC 43380]|nr:hypothetical protein yrohd0001_6190 [Yersinia rohdei ATCC 43380]